MYVNGKYPVTPATARLVAVAILFSMCIATAGGILFSLGVIPEEGIGVDPQTGKTLRIIFLIIGIGTIGLSYVLRAALDKRAAKSANPERGQYLAVIVSMALGETPATLALVNGILTHHLTTTLLLGVAAIITGLLHFPRAALFKRG